jgi:hypothetical protein
MTLGGRGVGVLIAALVTALLAVLPVSAAQASGDVVTFPDVEDINPKATPYSITIDDAGGVGHLVARWVVDYNDPHEIELPHEGTATLPFVDTFAENFTTRVFIYRCVNPTWSVGTCVSVDYTPEFNVWVNADPDIWVEAVGTTEVRYPFDYDPPGLGVTTWRLLAADRSELSSGQTSLGPGAEIPLSVPLGTPEQQGSLLITTSVDGTVVGHLDGFQGLSVPLDGVPPPAPTVTMSTSVVYPYRDGYLDSIVVTTQSPGSMGARLAAVEQATGKVYRVDDLLKSSDTSVFTGVSVNKQMPAGIYRFRVVSQDAAGESSTLSEPFELRWDRVERLTWRRTVPAAKTVIKKYVGACGKLSRPADPGWRGSLGYYSGTCRDPKRALVQVIHGLNLPPSMNGKYAGFRVSVTGGPNRRQPGSYLVLGYYTNAKKWGFEHREVLRGSGVQTHQGHRVRGRETPDFIHEGRRGPYVAWSTGLTSGSRYDVKSFTVEITYVALVPEPQ